MTQLRNLQHSLYRNSYVAKTKSSYSLFRGGLLKAVIVLKMWLTLPWTSQSTAGTTFTVERSNRQLSSNHSALRLSNHVSAFITPHTQRRFPSLWRYSCKERVPASVPASSSLGLASRRRWIGGVHEDKLLTIERRKKRVFDTTGGRKMGVAETSGLSKNFPTVPNLKASAASGHLAPIATI